MTNRRHTIRSHAPWENVFGYARAVRIGNQIAVSGSAAVGADGRLVGEGDMHAQARRCIEVILDALADAGAGAADVIRTRVFTTDIGRWEEIARAHRQVFGETPPATTLVEVSRLIDPAMLVEMEADAILPEEAPEDSNHR